MSDTASSAASRSKITSRMKELFDMNSLRTLSVARLSLTVALVVYTIVSYEHFSLTAFGGAFIIATSVVLLVKYLRKAWWTGTIFGVIIASVVWFVVYDMLKNGQSLTANIGTVLWQTFLVAILIGLLLLIATKPKAASTTDPGTLTDDEFNDRVDRRIASGELTPEQVEEICKKYELYTWRQALYHFDNFVVKGGKLTPEQVEYIFSAYADQAGDDTTLDLRQKIARLEAALRHYTKNDPCLNGSPSANGRPTPAPGPRP